MFGADEDLVEDPVAGIGALVDRLAVEDRSGWPGAARSERVLGLLEVAERLQAEVLLAVGEWDRVAAWGQDGALSPVAWLTARAPVTRPGAARLVRSARLVRTHEPIATALAKGETSVSHVEQIARAIRHREDVFATDGEPLVEAACELTPEAFRSAARRWRCLADDIVATEEAHARHLRRYVDVSETLGGVALGAFLDGDAGGTVVSALDAYTTIDPPGDPSPRRTLAQRRADALVEICAEVLARKQRTGRSIPNIDGTFDYPTLVDRTNSATSPGHCATSPASDPSPAPSWNASAAPHASAASSSPANPSSSTRAAAPPPPPPNNAAPSPTATAAASSPAATGPPPGPTPTTSSSGSATTAPPTSTTSSSSAAATTSSATKAAGPSNAPPTAPSPPPHHPDDPHHPADAPAPPTSPSRPERGRAADRYSDVGPLKVASRFSRRAATPSRMSGPPTP